MKTHLLHCLDPEAGIEEEYHPKSNTVYCFRTMRIIKDNFYSLENVNRKNGDLEVS